MNYEKMLLSDKEFSGIVNTLISLGLTASAWSLRDHEKARQHQIKVLLEQCADLETEIKDLEIVLEEEYRW